MRKTKIGMKRIYIIAILYYAKYLTFPPTHTHTIIFELWSITTCYS